MNDVVSLNIKQFRESAGLTQLELAIKADLTPAHIGKIERGKWNVRLNTLSRIAEALNIPIEELIRPKEAA